VNTSPALPCHPWQIWAVRGWGGEGHSGEGSSLEGSRAARSLGPPLATPPRAVLHTVVNRVKAALGKDSITSVPSLPPPHSPADCSTPPAAI
jgi:hypothetical protein